MHHGDDPRLWGEVGVLEHFRERHPEATAAFEEVWRLAPEWLELAEPWREMYEASRSGRHHVP